MKIAIIPDGVQFLNSIFTSDCVYVLRGPCGLCVTAVDDLSIFPSVTFHIQKSRWREQPVWKRTDHSLLPPLPSPCHRRTCSAQSRLWPAQASLRGVSTVRTQHCGATCPPFCPLLPPCPALLFPPDLQSGAPMPHRPHSGALKTNDQFDFCFVSQCQLAD